ncbi:MAG: ECF transporter S component [Clostridia bacterium]|nr:ECF transporter S component [Clostridia bacterium]
MWATAATAMAVALPQVCHLLGAWLGVGSRLGEMLLPMHLPVMLIGLLVGWRAGLVAGLFSPVISFLLTGMPGVLLLPFMTVELAVYGLCTGLLRAVSMPGVCRVLLAQVAGRGVRALAILLAVYGFGYAGISPSLIWMSISTGAVGILLQLVLLPSLCHLTEKKA